jgi:hypothetical protein
VTSIVLDIVLGFVASMIVACSAASVNFAPMRALPNCWDAGNP